MSEKSQTIRDFSFCRPSQILPICQIKPVFHMSGKSQTIGDFTFSRPSQILPIYRIIARRLSQILPIMNLAGNGKCAKNWVLNKKCNSIYTATLMHTSLCCVVLNTSVFLHSSMQGFPFWKSRSQLKTPYHSSSFLGKRFEIAMTRIFEKHHVYLCLFTIGGLEPSK